MSEPEQNVSAQVFHPYAQLTLTGVFLWCLFLLIALGFGAEILGFDLETDLSPLQNQLLQLSSALTFFIFALFLLKKLTVAGFSRLIVWGPTLNARELIAYFPAVFFQFILSFLLISFIDLSINLFFSEPVDWLASSNQLYQLPDGNENTGLEWIVFNICSFIAVVVIAPIAEEVIFRSWMLHRLAIVFRSPGKALIISAVIFGCLHEQGFLGSLCFALFLGVVYLQTGSLRLSVFLHALNNLLVFFIALGLEYLMSIHEHLNGPVFDYFFWILASENATVLWLAEGILLIFLFLFFIRQIKQKWPTQLVILPLFPEGIPVLMPVTQKSNPNKIFEAIPLANLRLHHAFFMMLLCGFIGACVRLLFDINKHFVTQKIIHVFNHEYSFYLPSNAAFLLSYLVLSLVTFGTWILWLYLKYRPLPLHFADFRYSQKKTGSWRLLAAFALFQWVWLALTQGPLHFLPARIRSNHWSCCFQDEHSGWLLGVGLLFFINALIWAWAEQLGRQLLLYRLKNHALFLAGSTGLFLCFHLHNPITAIGVGLWLGYLTLSLQEPGPLLRILFFCNLISAVLGFFPKEWFEHDSILFWTGIVLAGIFALVEMFLQIKSARAAFQLAHETPAEKL